jgi:hypothetical protein
LVNIAIFFRENARTAAFLFPQRGVGIVLLAEDETCMLPSAGPSFPFPPAVNAVS